MKFIEFVGFILFDQEWVLIWFYFCKEGLFKVIGQVIYVYEYWDVVLWDVVYGFVFGFDIVYGSLFDIDIVEVEVVLGVQFVLIYKNMFVQGENFGVVFQQDDVMLQFVGIVIYYYDQVIVLVVVDIFEQVCVVVCFIWVCYCCLDGVYDFVVQFGQVELISDFEDSVVGDFDWVFGLVLVWVDVIYIIFDQLQVLMELYFSFVYWEGDWFMFYILYQILYWVYWGLVKILQVL